jgi:putative transposase
VDTVGNLLKVVVHPAGDDDREGAEYLLEEKAAALPRLQLIWADQRYGGQEFGEWVQQEFEIVLEIVQKVKDQVGFVLLPRRWVVERFFAWLGNFRRLSKDYEFLPEASESWIYLASIHLMLKRLCRGKSEVKPHRSEYNRRFLDYVEDTSFAA